MSDSPRIVVAGAGAIGCFVGGLLAAAGHDVRFLGREGRANDIAKHGLTLRELSGQETRLAPVSFDTEPACLAGADIVLLAVKSGGTEDMARSIAAVCPKAVVVSLQNGISNPERIRRRAPDADVRGAVVEFNVIEEAPGTFRQATSGAVWLEDETGALCKSLAAKGLELRPSAEITAVQWGKLLVNLNNALNALSGLPLLEQLQDRRWRRLLAAQMSETLRVLKAAGITPARFTAAPPGIVPHILRLPDPLFTRIAKTMLTIDPAARSSMQDDLRALRRTEIDALQGEVQRLAGKLGQSTPVIDRVVAAIRTAETAAKGPPMLDPRALSA